MNNLLKFEFRKLFRLTSFYILAGCTAACAAAPVLLRVLTGMLFGMSRAQISSMTGASDFLTGAATGTGNIMIFGLFISLYVCGDYMENTMKNIVARGYSRTQIFLAHFITGSAAGAMLMVLSWVVSFALSGILWGMGYSWSINILWELLLQLLLVCGYTAVFQFVSTLIRKTGGALVVCVLLPLGATSVLSIVDMLIQNILKHEPPFALSSCTLTSLLKSVSSIGADAKTMWIALAGAAAYTAVFAFAGSLIAKRQEI